MSERPLRDARITDEPDVECQPDDAELERRWRGEDRESAVRWPAGDYY